MERKRFLAVVMTVMMVISMIPSMVFAAASSGELGGKLKIKGLAAVGVVLSADYAKVTPEEVTDEDFTFSWSRQTGEKELTQVGTEKTYTITQDDLGCRLVLDLTPVDGSGLTGTLTAKTLEVAATEEEAKAVEQEAEDTQQTETADGTENAQLEETADETGDAQLEETEDNAEGSQDSENQDVDRTEDVQQNAGNEQEDESQNTKGQPEETTEGTDDSQMKIYTEDQLQVDENGNVQTDGSEKDQKTYETTATVEDSEDQICDFGTVKGDLEDVEAQYVQITNTGNESLNFQEISPEHFMAQDIIEPLSAGESVSVWIQPREGLEPGEYDDMITYRTEEGIEVSFEAKIAVEGEDDSSDDEDLKPSDEPSAEPTETPDDSEAPSAGDNADASLEAQSLDVNTGSLNFSDIEENYTQANETLSVTVTNTGDGTVTLKIPKSDYFEVMNEDGSEAVSGIQIAKGDSLMFMVQPKTGLTKGDYSDTLIFESEEDSEVAAQVTAEVSVKEAEQEQITAVQADPESFSYDDLKEGYDTPEATTITLTNTGNTTVSLMQPYAEYFDIGELSASVLEPGDSAAFTAVPVTGLKVGNYLDSIQIAQTSSEGQEDVLTTIKASATVSEVKKIYKLSVTPEELNFGKAKEGYSEAPEAQKVTVTNEGNTNVTLNAPSGKNFKIGKLSATELAPGESCTFKIRPKAGLKAGSYTESVVIDNEQQISAEVKVQFTVKATRKAKIADPAHPQQQLAAGIRRQAGDGLLCAGIDGGKGPEGDAPPGAPADGDVPALPLQQQFPLHRGPGPGLIAVFVRQMSLLVPVPGVDPIEHSLQKARPGGFPALIGSLDQIEARGELQPLLRQPAEGGCHPFDPHGATSSPFSRAARPKRTACWRISFSGSARHRAAIRRRNSPVRVSSSIRSHTARCTRVRSRRVRP